MKLTILKGKSFIRPKDRLLGLLIVIALTLLVLRNQKPGLENSQPEINEFKSQEGYLAPRFTLRNLKGNLEGLDDHLGKVIIVNFWATWCTPCLKEIPAFVEFYNEKSDYVEILGLDFEPVNLPVINAFIDRFSVNYPIVLYTDTNDSQYSNFGEIVGMPTTLIYSPEGELLQTFMGEITIEDLNKFISPIS